MNMGGRREGTGRAGGDVLGRRRQGRVNSSSATSLITKALQAVPEQQDLEGMSV